MSYSIKMFDSQVMVIAVESAGYGSVVRHSHEFVELVYVKRGWGVHIFDSKSQSKSVEISEGDIFVLADPNVSHSIHPGAGCAEEGFVIVNVIFPHGFFDLNYALFRPDSLYRAADIPGGAELVAAIQNEYDEKRNLYEKITFSLTQYLLCRLARLTPKLAARNEKNDKQKQLKSYIDIAIAYIHSNYDKRIGVDDVAGECGVCKAYLQRLFRRECNTSILEYLIKYRIEQSCKLLLSTDYSVATISEMVGFYDLKYFYLKFKEIVGETPMSYKRHDGGKNGR